MKTEPDVFSYSDLVASPKHTAPWDGVRNYQARNFMRDDFKLGDRVFVYHSRVELPAIVGLAQVVKEGYTDHTALDPKSKYFDEKAAKKKVSPWIMVNVQALGEFQNPITLASMREDKFYKDMLVIKPGQRLSIQPVEMKIAEEIIKRGKLKAI